MSQRHVYDQEHHAHFVTFSCYKRRKLLNPERAKRIVIGILGSRLARQNGLCIGFVVMPDHVHCLVWFEGTNQLVRFVETWKELTSKRIKDLFQRQHPEYWYKIRSDDPIWQAGYYPFHVHSRKKIEEKLDYMHLNPVRCGLVDHVCDWPWSSARWYLQRKPVGLPIRMPPL